MKNIPNTEGLIHNTHQNMNKLTYLITEGEGFFIYNDYKLKNKLVFIW